jgi:Domain of unknown function (DUF6458)
MALGSSVFLIVAGVFVAAGLGAQPGRADMRTAGWLITLIGLAALWLTIVLRYQSARRERRAATARPRWRTRPRRVAGPRLVRYPRRPIRSYGDRTVTDEPQLPLSSLGQIVSLVHQSQVRGQHGKLPPSPLGKLRYPC